MIWISRKVSIVNILAPNNSFPPFTSSLNSAAAILTKYKAPFLPYMNKTKNKNEMKHLNTIKYNIIYTQRSPLHTHQLLL